MAENSEIAWTNHTLNLWWGCKEVHEGCDNCYAKVLAHRWGDNVWGNDVPRREIKSWKSDVMKFQRKALEANEVHRVFVGSMMDIFEKPMPLVNSKGESLPYKTDTVRNILFNEIIPNCPNLIFLLLTKRPSNINKYIPKSWKENPPKNVMFGTSPVNQATAEKLIPQLLEVKGKHFLSIEPQLDSINIQGFLFNGGIDWVIQGGESGHGKRPFNTDWAYYLKDQCKKTKVPYFFKQIDKVQPIPSDLMIRKFPK
jgi:protein gp37